MGREEERKKKKVKGKRSQGESGEELKSRQTGEESGQSRENRWVERKEEKGRPVLNNHINLFTR